MTFIERYLKTLRDKTKGIFLEGDVKKLRLMDLADKYVYNALYCYPVKGKEVSSREHDANYQSRCHVGSGIVMSLGRKNRRGEEGGDKRDWIRRGGR